MLDFPASPVEGNFFNHPTAPNTFNYSGGKWRQERAWVHLYRARNWTVVPPPNRDIADGRATISGVGHYVVLPAGFQFFKILLRRFEPSTVAGPLVFRVSGDNGANYSGTGYVWNGFYHFGANASASWYQGQWTGSLGYVPMSATTLPAVNNGGPGMIDIDIDRGGNGIIGSFTLHSAVYAPSQGYMHTMVSGYANGTNSGVTNIMFFCLDYASQYYAGSTLAALDLFGAP